MDCYCPVINNTAGAPTLLHLVARDCERESRPRHFSVWFIIVSVRRQLFLKVT